LILNMILGRISLLYIGLLVLGYLALTHAEVVAKKVSTGIGRGEGTSVDPGRAADGKAAVDWV
jgi:hypothetical protein